MTVSVADPHAVSADPAMPFVRLALDPVYMQPRLEALMGQPVRLAAVRVMRWRPGRRCVIEYDLSFGGSGDAAPVTFIGKVRARSFDHATYALTKRLGELLNATDASSCVSTPAARGAMPECHMWLQDKVAGDPAWLAIGGPDGAHAARRIGRALACLHRALPPLSRRHLIAEELAILAAALDQVRLLHPSWDTRLRTVQRACERAAAALPRGAICGIHRDFYHEQVLVDRDRVWILDLDLAAEGDPALDAGNFIAHLAEQSLRLYGDQGACAEAEAAFIAGFQEGDADAAVSSVEVFKTLSLARHIYISTLFESRRRLTEALLTLCEQRLQL